MKERGSEIGGRRKEGRKKEKEMERGKVGDGDRRREEGKMGEKEKDGRGRDGVSEAWKVEGKKELENRRKKTKGEKGKE